MESGRNVLGPVASCVTVVLEKCPPLRASKTTSGRAKRCPRAGPLESEHDWEIKTFHSKLRKKKKNASETETQTSKFKKKKSLVF